VNQIRCHYLNSPSKTDQENQRMVSQIPAPLEPTVLATSSYGDAPFLDLKAQFEHIRGEVLDVVAHVLTSQHFILGPELVAFEHEVAAYVGAEFAIGCGSGSDALLLAQMAVGIGPGDEVITAPFTFGATAGSIARLGARPVFVDIRPDTFNLDEHQLEAAITPRTRAIMPVHLFGQPSNMDLIMAIALKHQLFVIEDAAQAIGAQWKGKGVGTIGTLGCFSFFPSKNLGGAGDGGMITTNDARLAKKLSVLRVHGAPKKYTYDEIGINSRLDALQAAILRVKLRHLKDWTLARRRNAGTYNNLFDEYELSEKIILPSSDADCFHVYNQFSIRVPLRNDLHEYLRDKGIPTEIYYPSPLHVEAAFSYLGYRDGDFPVAESACREVLSLPIYPELKHEQQRAVVAAIANFYRTGIPGAAS
jgi:dTDP-4-amino-4,6-dideoxygalactose transaminase